MYNLGMVRCSCFGLKKVDFPQIELHSISDSNTHTSPSFSPMTDFIMRLCK